MAKADKEPPVIYRTWCPDAGQTNIKGYLELGALDVNSAARIHAERMTDLDWTRARHGGRKDAPWVKIQVWDPSGAGRTYTIIVRRRMEPVFEVVT